MNVSRNIYIGQPIIPSDFYAPTDIESQFFNSMVMGGYGTKYNASSIAQIGDAMGSFLI